MMNLDEMCERVARAAVASFRTTVTNYVPPPMTVSARDVVVVALPPPERLLMVDDASAAICGVPLEVRIHGFTVTDPWQPTAGQWALDKGGELWWVFQGPDRLMAYPSQCPYYPRRLTLVQEQYGPLRPAPTP